MRSQTDALPVRLALGGPHRDAIRRWVESVAGWQPVDDDVARLVPPRLVLADVPGSQDAGHGGLPLLLLVGEGADPAVAAAAGSRAAAVVRWPDERDRILEQVATLASPERPGDVPTITVGGTSGGVGTTTLALALGGIAAWHLGATLVITHGSVPAPTTRTFDRAALGGAGTWDAADPVPGVVGLRLVRTDAPAPRCEVDPGAARFIIHDAGVAEDVDVLVARRDRAGTAALARSAAAVVLIADVGLASLRAVRVAADGRRLITVPWSARVARAGLRTQVPAAIPATWLRRIAPALSGRTQRLPGDPLVGPDQPSVAHDQATRWA